MQKLRFTDDQTAFEYAFYMIASSYFDKTICRSKRVERDMYLQYKEQKLEKQYQYEDICIKFMEKLKKCIPAERFEECIEVSLKRDRSNAIKMVIKNENLLMKFNCIYSGKKSKILYEIKVRKNRRSGINLNNNAA